MQHTATIAYVNLTRRIIPRFGRYDLLLFDASQHTRHTRSVFFQVETGHKPTNKKGTIKLCKALNWLDTLEDGTLVLNL